MMEEIGLPLDDSHCWDSSWSMKGRRRQGIRLSASVDSLPCLGDPSEFFSSSGSFSNYQTQDLEEDGSVNNILDAVGERVDSRTAISNASVHRLSGAQSWSVLDSVPPVVVNSSSIGGAEKNRVPPPPPLRTTPISKGDESSGLGTDTLSSISPSGSSSASAGGNPVGPSDMKPNLVSTNPSNNQFIASSHSTHKYNGNDETSEYEHVYCQLDPYFNPPSSLGLMKSHSVGGIQARSSLRSWGRSISNATNTTIGTLEKDIGILSMIQQALVSRYSQILEIFLEGPDWYKDRMKCTISELDEICPVVYRLLSSERSQLSVSSPVYGLLKKKCTVEHEQHSLSRGSRNHCEFYSTVPLHHLLTKHTEENEPNRTIWLEGDAGSGKTLLCLKFLQEWLNYYSYDMNHTTMISTMSNYSLLLYIPLKDVKGSLKRFIDSELITKRSINSKIGGLWKYLEKNESISVNWLFILDGVETVKDVGILNEIQSIMNGITFPNSRIILTSRNGNKSGQGERASGNLVVSGMSWNQIQSRLATYFIGKKYGSERRLLEILCERHDLSAIGSNPFMCTLLCSIYEEYGDIPSTESEFFAKLIKALICGSGLMKSSDSSTNSHGKSFIPIKWLKQLEDLGKLCLSKLNEGRNEYSEQEVMEACGSLDILKSGILIRSKILFGSKGKRNGILFLIHPSLNIFLASNYLAMRIDSTNLILREFASLLQVQELTNPNVQGNNVAFHVLHLVMEILGKRADALLALLSLLDVSVNYILAFLRSGGFYDSNLNAVCSILKSLKHATIHVNSEWISEWKQVISHGNCPFESIEIMMRPGYSLSRLVEGLCVNESINTVKISSIPGQDWTHPHVHSVSGQLLHLLEEKKLKCLEICMTCLEDNEHARFQGLIDVLCYSLTRQVPLTKLVLDMDLTSSQIEQLSLCIRDHETLDILHLPHLGCGPAGFRSIAQLLHEKSFMSLSLTGSWRSTHSDEELGVITETLPPLSPFNLGKSFPSFPRGTTMQAQLRVKSPSIRRKRLTSTAILKNSSSSSNNGTLTSNTSNSLDKRNCDGLLFQKNFLPVPICDKENHEVDGFHGIFLALRDPNNYSHLRSLNLSKSVLNWEDVLCLGETIRKTQVLDSLRMEGMKLCDVLPILLGLQENKSLKLLDLSSPHVVIGDDALQLVTTSLSQNKSLRLLSIQGWTVYIEEERSFEMLENCFLSSYLQDLDLSSIRIHLNLNGRTKQKSMNIQSIDNSTSNFQVKKELTLDRNLPRTKTGIGSMLSLSSTNNASSNAEITSSFILLPPTLSFLRIGGASLELSKSEIWKSYDFFWKFGRSERLTHLDLSLDKGDSTGNFIDDKSFLKTLKLLNAGFPKLRTLILQHWKIRTNNEKWFSREINRSLILCNYLCEINLDNSTFSNENVKRIDGFVAVSILSSLKSLMDFSWSNFDESQLDLVINSIDTFLSSNLTIKLDGIPLKRLKAFLQTKNTGNIQYIGNNSMQIKRIKETGNNFMYRLKKKLM